VGPTGGLQLAAIAATLPAPIVIPMHALISGVSAAFRTWELRRSVDVAYVARFAIGSLAGSIVGITLLYVLTDVNSSALGVAVGLYLVATSVAGRFFPDRASQRLPSPSGIVTGAITGLLTIFVGASGPLAFALMERRFTQKERLVATNSGGLVIQHFSKVLLFALIGTTILQYPRIIAVLFVASWLGTQIGGHVLRRLPERTYRILAFLLVLIVGLYVLWISARSL
jgi:uncharacterized membrane protein YfcA